MNENGRYKNDKQKEIEFIRLSHLIDQDQRLDRIKRLLNISSIKKREANYLLNFLDWWDNELHETRKQSHKLQKIQKQGKMMFFEAILHSYLPHNVMAIMSLIASQSYFAVGSLLRNIIEFTLYGIWIDLISKGGDMFEFFWDSRAWKSLLRTQRADERMIRQKTKTLFEYNKKSNESVEEFRDRFFRESNEGDMLIFFSKFFCERCIGQNEFRQLYVDLISWEETAPSKNEIVIPVFQHRLNCEGCGSSDIKGFAFYVPTKEIVFEVLKKYFEQDETLQALNDLRKCYDIFSNHFLHFSMDVPPFSGWNAMFRINQANIDFNSFQIVEFVFNRVSFILCNYFMILKNDFKVYRYPDICETRKDKFNWYTRYLS